MDQDIEALLVELDANAKVDRRHGFTHDAEIWERAAAAIRELQADEARLDWIIDNARSVGGGDGFELRVWVGFDSEDLRHAIDEVMK